MPTRDEIIEQKTCKEVEDVAQRVYYVLTEDRQSDKTCRLVGHLINLMKDHGILTDQDIDNLLFETVM